MADRVIREAGDGDRATCSEEEPLEGQFYGDGR